MGKRLNEDVSIVPQLSARPEDGTTHALEDGNVSSTDEVESVFSDDSDDNDPNICRSLKRLSLHRCKLGETSRLMGDLFFDMLKSRYWDAEGSFGELEEFRVIDSDIDYVLNAETVREWTERGLGHIFR